MKHEIKQGCGHFWMIATLTWDDCVEIHESWAYFPDTQDRELIAIKGPPIYDFRNGWLIPFNSTPC